MRDRERWRPGADRPGPGVSSHFRPSGPLKIRVSGKRGDLPRFWPGTAGPPPGSGVPSGRFVLTGSLVALLGCRLPVPLPLLGLPLPPAQAMPRGASLTPRLVWGRGVRAGHAESQGLGLVPLCSGMLAGLFLALWGLVPPAFVLTPPLHAGFYLFWGRLDPCPWRPGLGCAFGSGLLPFGQITFGLGSSSCGDDEGGFEDALFGHPRARGDRP